MGGCVTPSTRAPPILKKNSMMNQSGIRNPSIGPGLSGIMPPQSNVINPPQLINPPISPPGSPLPLQSYQSNLRYSSSPATNTPSFPVLNNIPQPTMIQQNTLIQNRPISPPYMNNYPINEPLSQFQTKPNIQMPYHQEMQQHLVTTMDNQRIIQPSQYGNSIPSHINHPIPQITQIPPNTVYSQSQAQVFQSNTPQIGITSRPVSPFNLNGTTVIHEQVNSSTNTTLVRPPGLPITNNQTIRITTIPEGPQQMSSITPTFTSIPIGTAKQSYIPPPPINQTPSGLPTNFLNQTNLVQPQFASSIRPTVIQSNIPGAQKVMIEKQIQKFTEPLRQSRVSIQQKTTIQSNNLGVQNYAGPIINQSLRPVSPRPVAHVAPQMNIDRGLLNMDAMLFRNNSGTPSVYTFAYGLQMPIMGEKHVQNRY